MKSHAAPPKVSVIIPVYNGANFLKEAVDSALAQTYRNIEVLVINDGSTDGGATETIALSFGERVRYFSKPNGGVSTALNLGIQEMTGEYFSWLSHDDVYHPLKIQRQLECLKKSDSPETIIYGGYELIDDKSETINTVDFAELYPRNQLDASLFPVFRGLANGCTMLVHKSHFARVGTFREDLRATQDYDLWFRMFRAANVRFCPGIYVRSRVHALQTGRSNSRYTEEGDQLWTEMIDGLTDEEMCSMEGTKREFYIRTADFLRKHSLYVKAERRTRELAKREPKRDDKWSHNHTNLSDTRFMSREHLFKRLRLNLKQEGTWTTIRRIYRKLRG